MPYYGKNLRKITLPCLFTAAEITNEATDFDIGFLLDSDVVNLKRVVTANLFISYAKATNTSAIATSSLNAEKISVALNFEEGEVVYSDYSKEGYSALGSLVLPISGIQAGTICRIKGNWANILNEFIRGCALDPAIYDALVIWLIDAEATVSAIRLEDIQVYFEILAIGNTEVIPIHEPA